MCGMPCLPIWTPPARHRASRKRLPGRRSIYLSCSSRPGTRWQGWASHAPVRVQLVNMYFDTRRYASGILPAGRYDALRIDLGAGKGRNWWCVLYPGLCRSACGSYARPAENDLVCGNYILRLRLVEWVQQRTARREDVVLVG